MEKSSNLRVALVHAAGELQQITGTPNIIVLPEGIDEREIWMASSMYPEAVVVGAVRVWEGKTVRMRGVVRHKGKNHINYLKASDDYRTSEGTGDFDQNPVASFTELGISIGVLICRDVGDAQTSPMLRDKVIDSLKKSSLEKLLCIPADMITDSWFQGESIDSVHHGIYVALCNQLQEPGQIRTKSFIANTDGKKFSPSPDWPICVDLPVTSL